MLPPWLFIISLLGAAILIVGLTTVSQWIGRWYIRNKKNNDQRHRTPPRDYRHRGAKQSDGRAIATRIDSLTNQLQSQNSQQERQDNERSFREKLVLGATIIAALGAVVSAGFLGCQLRDAREVARIQHDDADLALKAVQRAFIGIKELNVARSLNKETGLDSWRLQPVIEDVGATPPKWMNISVAEIHFPDPDFAMRVPRLPKGASEPYDPEDIYLHPVPQHVKPPQNTVLLPHEPENWPGFYEPLSMFQKIRDGYQGRIFILGAIHYADIFPKSLPHITKFCYEIGVDAAIAEIATPSPSRCNHWNCFDQQCVDDKMEFESEGDHGPFVWPPRGAR